MNTLAESYIVQISKGGGSAEEEAAGGKKTYECISRQNYICLPLAFETMGSWSKDGICFLFFLIRSDKC